jgi:hypothetical protein
VNYVAPSPIKDSSAKGAGAVNEGTHSDNAADKRGGQVRPDRR